MRTLSLILSVFGFGIACFGCAGRAARNRPAAETVHQPASSHAEPKPALTNDPEPWRSSPPPESSPGLYEPPTIQESSLSNGVKVLLIEDHSLPLVELGFFARAGANEDPIGKRGTSAVLAESFTDGARDIQGEALRLATEEIASPLRVDSDYSWSGISVEVLPSDFEPALSLLTSVVRKPNLKGSYLEKHRADVTVRISKRRKQARTIAELAIRRSLLGIDAILSHDSSGEVADLAKINARDVVAFYDLNWRPDNVSLVIVGDVDARRAVSLAERLAGSWRKNYSMPSKSVVHRASMPKQSGMRTIVIDKPGASQTYLAGGFVVPPVDSSQWPVALIVNNIFGGTSSSKINQVMRWKRGYTYGVNSRLVRSRETGLLWFGGAVDTANLTTAMEDLLSIVDQMHEPLDEQTMRIAQDAVRLQFASRFEERASSMRLLADLFGLGLDANHYRDVQQAAMAIDSAAASSFVRNFIDKSALTIVLVGPKSEIMRQLAGGSYGSIEYQDSP